MRKYGKFSIDRKLFDKAFNGELVLEDLQRILSNFIILRAECMFCEDTIEYHAYSTLFEELETGCIAPEYILLVDFDLVKDSIPRMQLLGVKKL